MHAVTKKQLLTGIISFFLVVSSTCYAGNNPFKKSKKYNFGTDVVWYQADDAALKSGSVQDGSNFNYYHLNINNEQLLLRLGRNDPSGQLENTRPLSKLAINEVNIDGQRLPLFASCLRNQQNPSRKLKQGTIIANDECINDGGNGDFIINLDAESKRLLLKANTIEFVVEPYGRPVSLTFSMSGYAAIMAEINKPVPVVVKKPEPVVVKAPVQVKPKSKPKPVIVVKKPKPAKMCKAHAPADFKSAVPAISYPCNNRAKKSAANIKVAARVEHEKKKMMAELDAAEKEKKASQTTLESDKREIEWKKEQSAMWVKRCQRHWAKNKSPCYCQKYLSQAPSGVVDSCGK